LLVCLPLSLLSKEEKKLQQFKKESKWIEDSYNISKFKRSFSLDYNYFVFEQQQEGPPEKSVKNILFGSPPMHQQQKVR
jgi:hypothetical protein